MTELVATLIQFGFSLWNMITEEVFTLVGQTPMDFAEGSVWDKVLPITPIFIAIGANLVVVFFLAGYLMESTSIREEMHPDNIIRLLIRLGFSQVLVVYNIEIITFIFSWVGKLINLLGSSSAATLYLTQEQVDVIAKMDFLEGLIVSILGIIIFIITLVCAYFMVFEVYFRFIRVFVLIPYGAIATSTFAGTGQITSTMTSYTRFFISTVFEGVTIVLSIIVANAFVSGGIHLMDAADLPETFERFGPFLGVLLNLIQMLLVVGITVGSVKGAKELTGRIFGA